MKDHNIQSAWKLFRLRVRGLKAVPKVSVHLVKDHNVQSAWKLFRLGVMGLKAVPKVSLPTW